MEFQGSPPIPYLRGWGSWNPTPGDHPKGRLLNFKVGCSFCFLGGGSVGQVRGSKLRIKGNTGGSPKGQKDKFSKVS